ncbi:MAG: cobaltochelatase subunit CobN [Thermodesulfobacteriota bacterium]|nr:cobaltochelatase subunit CobN [Thermodesulfobacteriota bacterium]
MIKKSITLFAIFLFVILLFTTPLTALGSTNRIGFFVGDSDAFTCHEMIKNINIPNLEIEIFTEKDCFKEKTGSPKIREFIKTMDGAVVDIMQSNPADWLLKNMAVINPHAKIYAVRSSSHTADFADAGFVFDKKVKKYFSHTDSKNLKNLALFIAKRDFSMETEPEEPQVPKANSLYHPDADRFFKNMDQYLKWYKESKHFQKDKLWSLLIIFPTTVVDSKKRPVDLLMKEYEKNGINTVALMRSVGTMEDAMEKLISKPPLKKNLGSITGFAFKFSSALSSNILSIFKQADVPVFNPLYLFFTPKEKWLTSPAGISPAGIAMQFSTPELTGLVEPTVTGVKQEIIDKNEKTAGFIYVPAEREIKMLAKRVAKWHRLKTMKNQDKKIVLMYYNHGAGKQNIGASYLNVAKSIKKIITRLKKEGYSIKGDCSPEKIMDLLIKTGRNIGSWAPGELERLSDNSDVLFIDINEYKDWIKDIDSDYLSHVNKGWGKPEESTIMAAHGKFIIPCVKMGNLTLVPQPSRGWGDDPEKLFHSTKLYPHHQYTAFYLWLQNVLQPDAMISLGTHGTHEWLPGKQAGMTQSCPPEVLLGDIPSLYPYIVDDIGEGIQAKRRGRAVIIDHAVPPFKKGGIYEEYSLIAALISELESADSQRIKNEKLKRIKKLVLETGLHRDLDLKIIDEDSLEAVEHYILELKTDLIPYGLHTFGESPKGDGLKETAIAIAEKSDQDAVFYEEKIKACGESELRSLTKGLCAGYIEPGSGNDPVRNPESLPTGKNFYSFDPDKVPSREAWIAGKKAGSQLIKAYQKKHDDEYPKQVGIILWSVETIRNEGINSATALFLMGMKPVWDKRDKIINIKPIQGKELLRPRIDVLLQMSGLFRDTFPIVALMLDRAVKKAALLTDIKNYIAQNSAAIKAGLIKKGYSPENAEKYSTIRVFSAQPGAYGTKVEDITSASGLWEDDEVIAKSFIDMVSHGYSKDIWGRNIKDAYRANLKKVDTTVHSISSNLYSTMDNDDMFQYLGGLSMAVRKESGKAPDVFISRQKEVGKGKIESLDKTIGRELRSRYLNPKWIQGMKKEKYAGAREMEKFVEYMWGWQVTTPDVIDKTKWEQTYKVYVEDKYGLELKAFFNRANPWAYQSINARMLEAVRKDYWQADEKTKQTLAKEYAVSVVEKGVACCEHTCNNPLLNQMVVNLISIPGVLPDKMVQEFKIAVEKATGKKLSNHVKERKELIKDIKKSFNQHQNRNQNQNQNNLPDLKKKQPRKPENRPVDKLEENPANKQKDKPADKQTNKQKEKIKNKPEKTQENISESAKGEEKKIVKGYKIEEVTKEDKKTEMTSSGAEWVASLFVIFLICLIAAGAIRSDKNRQ